ncbi:MAG: wax ester/triacylglycerol synthase family O-acyltransferase [Deltaproteobacteria bacterium]|nr:wax ester/triacylglycerol synthase family O-acyltransferase [Deltaproteobacteria bacterium]MBW2723728.1 wax ester/triacylglycerol synthase family O-acyltransferase [Deltaproteobacteria bacterium]
MSYYHFDRLSALDAMFLQIEDPNVHMHVAAIALFEMGPLANPNGTLAFDRILEKIESALGLSPRFKQKLAQVPLTGDPVWVDDPRFNLSYHVRHTSLPHPGSTRALKRLAGRILSQKLDRNKSLWEMWVVEGVEDGKFAIIAKAHHCMVDGISGFDLFTGMLRLDPDPTVEPIPKWYPRPAPTPRRLFFDELRHRVELPLSLITSAPQMIRHPLETLEDARETLSGLWETISAGLEPTMSTSLNPEIGPYRRFDWTRTEIAAIDEIRSQLGGTLNDVVLATAAGAIGRFLRRRGQRTDGTFRAQIPVSTRTASERGQAGNRVVMLMAELPIDETDPCERLHRVIETTTKLKQSRQRAGVEFLERVGDQAAASLWQAFARFATWQRSFNVVITNVPGPPRPVYLLGARMLAIHPLVPLAFNQALGIALFSYDGALLWGINSDWDAMPDVHDLTGFIDEEFEALHKAAVTSTTTATPVQVTQSAPSN